MKTLIAYGVFEKDILIVSGDRCVVIFTSEDVATERSKGTGWEVKKVKIIVEEK